MSLIEQFNVGSRIITLLGTSSLSLSQTSNTAVTTQDGLTIDRNLAGRRRYYSCKASFVAGFTAASSQRTASIAINIQHSSDGTSWDNYTTGVAATYGTSGTGGYSTDYDRVASVSSNLNGARRFIRVQLPAPTFSDCSSGQGTFSGAAVVVLGGADELPAQ